MSTTTTTIAELPSLKGQELGTSDWIEVDPGPGQPFADATGDHQWIHVDPRGPRPRPVRRPRSPTAT